MNKVTHLEGKQIVAEAEAEYQRESQQEYDEAARVAREFNRRIMLQQAEDEAEEYFDQF